MLFIKIEWDIVQQIIIDVVKSVSKKDVGFVGSIVVVIVEVVYGDFFGIIGKYFILVVVGIVFIGGRKNVGIKGYFVVYFC